MSAILTIILLIVGSASSQDVALPALGKNVDGSSIAYLNVGENASNGVWLFLGVTKDIVMLGDNSSEKIGIVAVSWNGSPVNGTVVRFVIKWENLISINNPDYVEKLNVTKQTDNLGLAEVVFSPDFAGKYLVEVSDEYGNTVRDDFYVYYSFPEQGPHINTTCRKYLAIRDMTVEMKYLVMNTSTFTPVSGAAYILIKENYSTEVLNESVNIVDGLLEFSLNLSKYSFDNSGDVFFGSIYIKIKKDSSEIYAGDIEILPNEEKVVVLPEHVITLPDQNLEFAIHSYGLLDGKPISSQTLNITVYLLNITGVQALIDAGLARDILISGKLNTASLDFMRSHAFDKKQFETLVENGFATFNLTVQPGVQAALVDVNGSGYSVIAVKDVLYQLGLFDSDVRIDLDVKWDVRFDPNVGSYVPQDNFTVELTLYNSTGYLPNSTVYTYSEGGGRVAITDRMGKAAVTLPIINSVLNTSDNILVFALYQNSFAFNFAKLPPLSPYHSEINPYAIDGKLFVSVSNYYLDRPSVHPFVLEVRKISEDGMVIEDISAEYVNASSVLKVYDVGYGRYEVVVSYDNEFGHHEFRKTVVYSPVSFKFSKIYLPENGSAVLNVPVTGNGTLYMVENSRGFDGTVYSILNVSRIYGNWGYVPVKFSAPPLMKDGIFSFGVITPYFSMPNVSFGNIVFTDGMYSDIVPFYAGPGIISSGNDTVHVGLANLGTFGTGQIDVEVYVDGSLYGTYSAGPIMPHDVQFLDLALSMSPGVHEIQVVADASNATPEFDETNNAVTFYIIAERTYNVSGEVFLENVSGACSIYVDVYEHPFLRKVAHVGVDGSSYSVMLRNGTYDVIAFADLDCDGTIDADEPVGYAINKTVFSGPDRIDIYGSNVSGANITLNGWLNLKGDINGDWVVDISDVVDIVYMMFGGVNQDSRADFNGNGKVDVGDLARLVYYLVGNLKEI